MTPIPPSPDLWLFFLLVLGVIVLPGMDMAYVAGSALVGGLRGGAAAIAGIMAGGLVHVAVAMTGIATLLAVWPAGFDALLVAGSAYMAWVGWQILRSAHALPQDGAGPAGAPAPVARGRVFGRAVLTCLGNPKAYAFSLAVFPAFVHSGARPLAMQGVLLAAIVVSTQALVYGSVALVAAGTRRAVGGAGATRRMARVIGPLLMAGALVTVLAGWRPATAADVVPSAIARNAAPAAATLAASHDFDFLVGDWSIENRKRLGILKGDERWETFHAESHVRPLPAGVGNHDDFTAPAWRPGDVGVTVRLFSPQTGRWSLYWTNNHGAGLDPATGEFLPPVVGGFTGDVGVFEGDDTWDGRPIRVRYTWRRVDADHARWEQAFSPDAGRRWETNWTMDLTRIAPAARPTNAAADTAADPVPGPR